MVNVIFIVIFVAIGSVGVASWLLAIVEAIGIWRFWPWVFRAGIRIVQESRNLPPPGIAIGSKVETKTGKFKVVAPNVCFFRTKVHLFSLQVHTPFPIKGIIRWDDDHAIVEGRIPLFTSLFFAAWLAGWTIVSVVMAIQPGILVHGTAFLLLGWLFLAAIWRFSKTLEVGRAQGMLDEYAALSADPDLAATH